MIVIMATAAIATAMLNVDGCKGEGGGELSVWWLGSGSLAREVEEGARSQLLYLRVSLILHTEPSHTDANQLYHLINMAQILLPLRDECAYMIHAHKNDMKKHNS